LRWSAAGLLAATFPLIFMGGLVTSHQAGMSVPDWPNSWGYNMFLLPPSHWLGEQAGGVFYEHTHRLLGSLAGLAAVVVACVAWGPAAGTSARHKLWIALVVVVVGLLLSAAAWPFAERLPARVARAVPHVVVGLACVAVILGIALACRRPEPRPAVRRLALGLLILVIVQGTLGGLRVVLVNLDLAIIHGCLAQLFFCLAGLMAAMAAPWWQRPVARAPATAVFVAAVVATGLIVVQLAIGATMRHYRAGLAIPDMPLAYGRWLPPTDTEGLRQANAARIVLHDARLERVTLGQIWLHFAHRLGALAVATAVLAAVWLALRDPAGHSLVRRLAWLLLVLLALQLTLGWLTVTMRKPADIASYHVAVGALTLLTAFALAIRARRLAVLARREAA
jgi:cytochrome c oxidase assembly protein subunit 15